MKKKVVCILIVMLLSIVAGFSISSAINSIPTISDTILTRQAPELLWWYNLSAPSFGSSAVGDIDNDGNLEIVFGTYFNDENIYALNAENGTLLWKYDTGGCNDASPAIADVDLDGDLEVIVPASSPCRVYCFNGTTGAVEWSRSTSPNSIDSPPAIADVDNDGKPEVVFGTFYGYVYCLNGEDGSIGWRINLGTNSYIQSCPNILDLDGDQKLDIVVAQWAGDCRIYALYGENGSIKWYSDQPNDYMYHGGSFADIDEDGKPEIAIGCYDNHVYVLNGEDGSPQWNYPASYYVGAPTSLADLDNDHHLEIVYVQYNRIGVLSHTGTQQWSYNTGGNIFRGAAIADVNGDGILDVAFGSEDGILRVLRGDNGGVVWTYNLQAHYGRTFEMDHAPVIADFNNDGRLDVFIVGGYGISSPPTNNHGRAYALTAGNGTGPGWPMFRHDLQHSACFPVIDSDQSFVTLTNENLPHLITCPAGDAPVYQNLKVTCKDNGGTPLPGISASMFVFTLGNVDALWYGTLSCTFTAVDSQTDNNGEIRFTLRGDTSIVGNISIRATVQTIPLNDIDILTCKSPDYFCDGAVILGDFVVFGQDYGRTRWRSDFTGDGPVGLGDFVVFGQHYGHHV
jgi:outer membrane protein assembly factor BamB